MDHNSDSFDYVIIGAGTAGCVLAARLSEDPAVRVALIEAGGKDTNHWIHIPAGTSRIVGMESLDWNYLGEPEPFIGGRATPIPRGRTLGGSSSINGMVYIRGQKADYDGWQDAGNPGWGWNDILPYFMRSEDYRAPPAPYHGVGGALCVEPPRMRWPSLEALRDAAAQSGLSPAHDMAMSDTEICGFMDVTQRRGRRWSTATAFLKPAMRRSNLTVFTNAFANSLRFDGQRATGVEVILDDGTARHINASVELILAAGAIGSPQLLQLAGIGPADHLRQHGIMVRKALPGVGENLQDHLSMRFAYRLDHADTLNTRFHNPLKKAWMGIEYLLFRRGPLCMGAPPLAGFARSDPGRIRPNVQFLAGPFSFERPGAPPHRFDAISGGIYNLQPRSRGTVRVRNPNARDHPAILHNYLKDEDDQRVAIDSLRLMQRIFSAPAMAHLRPQQFRPPQHDMPDEALLEYGKESCGTAYHQVGTCRMGRDANAVVDARLRVHGVPGLRVVDASVMPVITSGNTNAPTIMIAEKAADMLREDRRIPDRRL
ncbi:MAG: GMC family oxidoreductase N-terminal domain-containing protein [Alphaproteobacteria bacterium]|nr:GMC family oxidoreductase N-terminal domain-containing protein [Alphaproteobacteria bacterium]